MDPPTTPKFVIDSAEASSMAEASGLTLQQLIPRLVKSAQTLARPIISKFHVGVVAVGSSGRIFMGANIEFPGVPLHHSIHAEQFLVTNLLLNGEDSFTHFAVSAAPCGHCRQFLQEIRGANDIKLFILPPDYDSGSSADPDYRPLRLVLPDRFGPDDLLGKDVPLLLETRHHGLSLNENKNGKTKIDVLKVLALEAANKSHAPYSKCPSGVAIMDVDGNVYKGSYEESAAYNPSLGPLQTALIGYIAGGGGDGYENIVAAVLVEIDGAVVKQEHTVKLLLESISPKCDFHVFHCCLAGSD